MCCPLPPYATTSDVARNLHIDLSVWAARAFPGSIYLSSTRNTHLRIKSLDTSDSLQRHHRGKHCTHYARHAQL